MMSAAWPSFTAAWYSPSAATILGAALALGLGLLGHRTLHVVGQRNVLDLDRRDLGAPGFGVLINNVLDLVVDARGIRQQLVQG